MKRVHVIGAGLAGLAAAVDLAGRGAEVLVYEGAGNAGGRCRSFFDDKLKARIDNGNHLILSGNRSVRRYLKLIGSERAFHFAATAAFPFFDLKTNERWTVRPGAGPLPLWLLNKSRGIPGAGVREYLGALKILFAGRDDTVAGCVGTDGAIYRRFWDPLTVAALNTPARIASARLLRAVLTETFFRGAGACRPMVARQGLSESLIAPALKTLKREGVKVSFKTRLSSLVIDGARPKRLVFGRQALDLRPDEAVVVALPPGQAREILPNLKAPARFHPIVNVHFKLPKAAGNFGDVPFLGILNGTAHWLFVRGNIASVTVSAADRLAEKESGEIARAVWHDVARALGIKAGKMPPVRVIKEKRATFSQTPGADALRPAHRTATPGLYLAGDWTQTGIPATIESAVRSGFAAARHVVRDLGLKRG